MRTLNSAYCKENQVLAWALIEKKNKIPTFRNQIYT